MTIPPPLFIAAPISGSALAPKLQRVNPLAIAYLGQIGQSLESVYPTAVKQLQAIAPKPGTQDAQAFLAATGLSGKDIWPSREAAPTVGKFRWAGAAVGLVAGALVGWPWPLVGAVGGAAIDLWRSPK